MAEEVPKSFVPYTIVIALFIFCSSAFANSGFDSATCKDFRSHLSSDFLQGRIVTPEDWTHPNGPKVQVYYYYKPVAGKKPYLFINGGPG
jgi:hypothetical protein